MENEGKKTTEKRKVGIAVGVSLAVGALIGGSVVYVLNGDSIKLGKILKEYGKHDDGRTLVDALTEYAKNSYWFYHVTPGADQNVTMKDLHSGAETLIKDAIESGRADDEVTTLIAFTKKAK